LEKILGYTDVNTQVDFFNSITPNIRKNNIDLSVYEKKYKYVYRELIMQMMIFTENMDTYEYTTSYRTYKTTCKIKLEICGGAVRDGIKCLFPHDIDIFISRDNENNGAVCITYVCCKLMEAIAKLGYENIKIYSITETYFSQNVKKLSGITELQHVQNADHIVINLSNKELPNIIFKIELSNLEKHHPKSDFDINCLVLKRDKERLYPIIGTTFLYGKYQAKMLSNTKIHNQILKILIKQIKNNECIALYKSYVELPRNFYDKKNFDSLVERNQAHREYKIKSRGYNVLTPYSQETYYCDLIDQMNN